MWKSGKDHMDDEKLDRFGDKLLRAFEASEAEINHAATSPFLYRRIRARIEAEERRLTEQRSTWMALLQSAKRAIPLMAMLAIVAFVTLMVVPPNSLQTQTENGTGEEAPTLISDVFAYSPDEMLASAVGVETGQSKQGGEKR
jgi:hypothetical protein